MNSCWPVQTILNCYNNERTEPLYSARETSMNFAKVVVYPVGFCLFQVELTSLLSQLKMNIIFLLALFLI